jgi:hypothetical protein
MACPIGTPVALHEKFEQMNFAYALSMKEVKDLCIRFEQQIKEISDHLTKWNPPDLEVQHNKELLRKNWKTFLEWTRDPDEASWREILRLLPTLSLQLKIHDLCARRLRGS